MATVGCIRPREAPLHHWKRGAEVAGLMPTMNENNKRFRHNEIKNDTSNTGTISLLNIPSVNGEPVEKNLIRRRKRFYPDDNIKDKTIDSTESACKSYKISKICNTKHDINCCLCSARTISNEIDSNLKMFTEQQLLNAISLREKQIREEYQKRIEQIELESQRQYQQSLDLMQEHMPSHWFTLSNSSSFSSSSSRYSPAVYIT